MQWNKDVWHKLLKKIPARILAFIQLSNASICYPTTTAATPPLSLSLFFVSAISLGQTVLYARTRSRTWIQEWWGALCFMSFQPCSKALKCENIKYHRLSILLQHLKRPAPLVQVVQSCGSRAIIATL